jgi:hypothetical protein
MDRIDRSQASGVDHRLGDLRQVGQLPLEQLQAALGVQPAGPDVLEGGPEQLEAAQPLVALLDAEEDGLDIHAREAHQGEPE